MVLTKEEIWEMRVAAAMLPNLTFDFKRFYREEDPEKRITVSRVLETIDKLEEKVAKLKDDFLSAMSEIPNSKW